MHYLYIYIYTQRKEEMSAYLTEQTKNGGKIPALT